MRNRRLYRWLAVAALLFVGLSVTLDVVALQVFESRAGIQIARGTAAERATADLGGLPFLPSFLRGRLREVEVEIDGASAGGLRVHRLSLRFQEASFPARKMISLARSRHAARARVEGSSPFGRVELTEFDLDEFVRALEPQVRSVRVTDAGVIVTFEPEEGGQPAEARFLPRIEDRRLRLLLVGRTGIPPRYRPVADRIEGLIDLPRVPDGLQADIRMAGGRVVIEAEGRDFHLWVGEAAEEEP